MFQGDIQDMLDKATVGEVVSAFLEQCGVGAAFGVISIHNMPFLDAIGRRKNIRFIASRGEAGAVNMADAYARVGERLGVVFTSTGVAAGNAAGSLIEAQTAGTPLLHITGQIETQHLDKNHAYIHEARDQLAMLKAVSKRAYRVTSSETALSIFKEAVQEAMTPPMGPVSIEIPINIQEAQLDWPLDFTPLPILSKAPEQNEVEKLARSLSLAKRPLLWLGGGARQASEAVMRLIKMGFGVVTSVQGRGVIPENHPASLGAFNMFPSVENFYSTCDAMVVVGSRLRGNETLKYKLKLPSPMYQIDIDPSAENGRPYIANHFLLGDSKLTLESLADHLEGKLSVDSRFGDDVAKARHDAEIFMRSGLGPYEKLMDSIGKTFDQNLIWVRDVTISNSTWGNRGVIISESNHGVHALGGGIGHGLQMAIGAAIASPEKDIVCLVGDGGLQVNIGELATAIQEGVKITLLLMNSHDYEVIKNIQKADYGGRIYFSDIYTPEFQGIANSNGWDYQKLSNLDSINEILKQARANPKSIMIELDMPEIGPFSRAFGGPPVKK